MGVNDDFYSRTQLLGHAYCILRILYTTDCNSELEMNVATS